MKAARLLFALLLLISPALAGVKLPKLIGDGMVLQRHAAVVIWGWASSQEPVTLHFMNRQYTTQADAEGHWQITLNNLQAGGPFEMQITAGNTMTIHDILVGDVWVCSGQSNMELPMRRVAWKFPQEFARPENKFIRYFSVPQKYNFKKAQEDLDAGAWRTAGPATLADFSAVAWFFASDLYATYKTPIGLINASLGGSPAEAWLSAKALQQFPDHEKEAQRFQDDGLIQQIEQQDRERMDDWYRQLRQKDLGYADARQRWLDPQLVDDDWLRMAVPGYWASGELGPVNGVVWFRKEIDVPQAIASKPSTLILGRIVDADSVFINGTFVGTTGYQYPPRRYSVPQGLFHQGKNLLVVRVISNSGQGGFVSDKPYEIATVSDTLDLKGIWQYKLGAAMPALASQTFIRWKPLGLYNAMISPLLNYRIKGVIWYQGESNTARPQEYLTLFPALIRDWRSHWQQGNFPFLFVQLTNFMDAGKEPSESNWAQLREAQLKTLAVDNTAMAVTIDVGEWNDIHPLDKKTVGDRLAIAAKKIAYSDNRFKIYSGPIYKSMQVDKEKVILSFHFVGNGLIAKNGKALKAFAIAGADKKFVWATAIIENNRVIVWSSEVKKPVAVRYAWADNPQGANLYNKEGLPASPFRTDDFK